ncbi:MAG: AMP-binding protein [Thermoanaerobaculaceae bacterium]|nr:AMP-binding protein [Thermoanaerobaculaceae bacterium]TAM54694.1 MAG: long-chain fatty acid--CoA ligase [Acidobacteriota bacterium]
MKVLNEEYPLFPVPHLESLQDLVRGSSQRHGAKLALEDLNETPIGRLTFRELAETVARFGRALRRLGLEERDHVAVIAENRVQWVVAYLAAASFNMVVVPIDKSLKENEIVTILHASDAKAVVFSEGLRDTVLTLASAVKGLKVFVDMDLGAREGRVHSMAQMIAGEPPPAAGDPFPRVDPDAVAVIVFTSGSMGRAKGVMLSQRNIVSNLMAMLSMVELLPTDRFLSVLPIHHTYECTCGVLCPLTVGASVHFARSLKTVVEDLQRVRATILLAVPLLYDKMLKRIQAGVREKRLAALLVGPMTGVASAAEAVGIGGLRRKLFAAIHAKLGGAIRILIVGGAAPNPEVSRGMRGFGFTLLQGYGLTETSPIVALNRLRKFRDDAAGLPLPNLEVRIDDADDEGRGEIVVRGPSVMLGYYKNEEATRQVLKDGWFHTGDYGAFDADGFLHVSGRKKNVIVAANGKNVFPEELEDQVNAIPLVLESVVYGARGPAGDEEISVLIVPNAEAVYEIGTKTGAEITRAWIEDEINKEIRALNRRLPLYKQIRRVQIKEGEFEKTTTQKIKRYLIHQEDTTH